jgi:DNA-binding XRE family transcriptional regulator
MRSGIDARVCERRELAENLVEAERAKRLSEIRQEFQLREQDYSDQVESAMELTAYFERSDSLRVAGLPRPRLPRGVRHGARAVSLGCALAARCARPGREGWRGGRLMDAKANRLRELRTALGLTQQKLARAARVSLRTVHSVERGAECRLDTQRKILRALRMDFGQRRDVFAQAREGA